MDTATNIDEIKDFVKYWKGRGYVDVSWNLKNKSPQKLSAGFSKS